MDLVTQHKVEQFAQLAVKAGWMWCGVQEAIPPVLSALVVTKRNITKQIGFDPNDFDPIKFAAVHLSTEKRKMTLKEKLHKIYEAIEFIEKRGENTGQRYDYIKAADVTNAIRKQLIDLKVYAEINFDFVGFPYTIARAKDKDAPFSAVNVKCSVVFHDLESNETSTGSGLGSGADGGDKAAYKAQT